MRYLRAVSMAFSMYSRLPMPWVRWSDDCRAWVLCAFPLVGAVLGLLLLAWAALADLLELDTFTILSEGIAYRNEGAGFYQGRYLYNLALPSGERVAAQINLENVQTGEDDGSGEVILPLGRVVWADLEEDAAFLEQITTAYPLDRTDFYVDMTGNTARYSQEERAENHVLVVQGITILVCFPLLHALGSHFGLFPAFFPSRRREGAA